MANRPIGKIGRPAILSKKRLLANFPNMKLKDLSSNSYTDRKFQTVLFVAKKEAAHARGKDPAVVKKPCYQTLRKYRSILRTAVVTTPGVQNERRHTVSCILTFRAHSKQELLDARSQISLAAALGGLGAFIGSTPAQLDHRLLMNVDSSSIRAALPVPKVLVHADSGQKLSQERRSAGTTMVEAQQRFFHLVATTSADGESICNIIIAKENTAKERTTILVCFSPVILGNCAA